MGAVEVAASDHEEEAAAAAEAVNLPVWEAMGGEDPDEEAAREAFVVAEWHRCF